MLDRRRRGSTGQRRLWQSSDPEGLRIAYLSTYAPRKCGIAVFCQDLLTSTRGCMGAGQPLVVAMENSTEAEEYGLPVRYILGEEDEEGYRVAAQFLNASPVDIVSIQHEFGIFGGAEGRGLYRFLDLIAKPVVTTFHTVLPDPEPAQRAMLCELARRSQRTVVMNALARDILSQQYGADASRIALLHHGAPRPSAEGRESAKARLGLHSRRVLSTFGLVGPGKGLEYVLRALPSIRRHHPEVCYLIVGKTHPGVQRAQKEGYRESLMSLAAELGMEDAVIFLNSYQTKQEIVRCLAATDAYLTPYLGAHQITSGTLAYAVAAGKAIVSTPYLYAQFLLGEGRGRLVPFRDSEAIAGAVNEILDRPEVQRELEARAGAYGRRMYWPTVGRAFLELCQRVAREQPVAAMVSAEGARERLVSRDLAGEVRRDDERSREAHITGPLTTAN